MNHATTKQGTPTFTLKPLSKEGLEGALAKAEHYRLLNQPRLAESICRDILLVDHENQKTEIVLLLSLTDQFGQSSSRAGKQAQEIADRLKDEYARIYFTGIIHERQGSVSLNSGIPGSDYDVYISTGGPGSPLDSANSLWERRYFGLIEDIKTFNLENPDHKKHVFLICHSFQVFCRYYGFGIVSKMPGSYH